MNSIPDPKNKNNPNDRESVSCTLTCESGTRTQWNAEGACGLSLFLCVIIKERKQRHKVARSSNKDKYGPWDWPS